MGNTSSKNAALPLEIERKYLIHFPDLTGLEQKPDCRKLKMTQIYLKTEAGGRLRIRKVEESGKISYYKTEKHDITTVTRTEVESVISQEEYEFLLLSADPQRRPIRKVRYCLPFSSHCFEIDVYPFWNDLAIMEVELASEQEAIIFPPEISVIREVTDEPEYRNSSLALIAGNPVVPQESFCGISEQKRSSFF